MVLSPLQEGQENKIKKMLDDLFIEWKRKGPAAQADAEILYQFAFRKGTLIGQERRWSLKRSSVLTAVAEGTIHAP